MKLNAQELRLVDEATIQVPLAALERKPLYFILENVYDTYNIGGIFRLAEALTVSKIYICGQTEVPPNAKIKKASIGTYKIVPWEYKNTAKEVINELQKQHIQIVAIEQDKRSQPYTQIPWSLPCALLVGNETYGVLSETLALVDQIAEIPMWGINKSLNVIVSAAIVGYHVIQAP
ncbi:MAG: TrmH family RNA methyltransferase [bacterium]